MQPAQHPATRDEEIEILRRCIIRTAEAYLEIFERTAARERWPADQWGHILAPFLTGEAQRAYRDHTPLQAGHYPELKRAILAHYGHSLPAQAQRYHDWTYHPLGSGRSQISHLVRLAERWLAEGDGPLYWIGP